MSKTVGSVRGNPASSNTLQNTMKEGATEKGYTPKMVKNILGAEGKIRNNKDESMIVFSETGDSIVAIGGKGAEVNYSGYNIPKDSIITHNHPRSIGSSGIKRIGNSFSKNDILSAIELNAKEIRAVTPTYTFSLKRPKGGWGASMEKVSSAIDRISYTRRLTIERHLNKVGWTNSNIARAEVTHWHAVMTQLSKEFGWHYSKKK